MKLEQIQEMWDADSQIDRLNLAEEILKIHNYHAKYYRIYVQEALRMAKMKEDHQILRLEKYEFYTQGPDETTPADWELPARGKILKNEVQPYLDADKHIVNSTLLLGLQKEKVNFVRSIIDSLNSRGYNIKAAIDYERWRGGS